MIRFLNRPSTSILAGAVLVMASLTAVASPLLTPTQQADEWNDEGIKYQTGDGVAVDKVRAAQLYTKACDSGNAAGCNNLGLMFSKGDGIGQSKAYAATLFSKACTGGIAKSCSNLGLLYYNGEGVAQNKTQASILFAKGCDGDSASGCHNLGYLYHKGEGVKQNIAYAAQLYSKACDGGYFPACSNLAGFYDTGQGVEQNKEFAAQLYRKACDGGNTVACGDLKRLTVVSPPPPPVARPSANQAELLWKQAVDSHIARRDYAGAQSLYEQSCLAGSADGCNTGGDFYAGIYISNTIKRDSARAVELYQMGCRLGNRFSCEKLQARSAGLQRSAPAASSPQPCNPRWKEASTKASAKASLICAAERGDVEAMSNLAYILEIESGDRKMNAESFKWFNKAAQLGNDDAALQVGLYYYDGSVVSKDYVAAARFWLEAARRGNVSAMGLIAEAYEKGLGVARNSPESERWYNSCAKAKGKSCR